MSLMSSAKPISPLGPARNPPLWKRPVFLLPATFLGAILVGTILLSLPGVSGPAVGLLEALFTATSAVCVTGLVVVDTGSDFTPAGQAIILALIQAGGLGIVTFSMTVLVIARKRVALEQDAALKETYTPVAGWHLGRLLAGVVGLTLLLEAIGALVLQRSYGDWWPSVFHSVSAFCNAGFSLHSDSLQSAGPGVWLPIAVLVFLGGLGFTTLLELRAVYRKDARRRYTLNTRLVLMTSGALILAGMLIFWILGSSVKDALFMSVSARTAGFDTSPIGAMSTPMLLIMMLLMFIGASPGSTGGGIKTTTAMLVLVLVAAVLRGRKDATIHGRTIPHTLLRRALAVMVCALFVIFGGIFALAALEPSSHERFLPLAFEAVSAVGTVGLSTGITAELTAASKLVLCVLMFVGRVGSLSIFLVLIRDTGPSRVQYPHERVLVG
jgi:trk system potassium uptake protein TrkH